MSPAHPDALVRLLAGRSGHFCMESGFHSETWYDLDSLLADRERLRPFVDDLAHRLCGHTIDAVCGPVVGGAILAQAVAESLGLEHFAVDRLTSPTASGFYPVKYQLPASQRSAVRGKRIGIVDDAISAGSAVRGTYADLIACGAHPVVCGALFVFGNGFAPYAAERSLPLEATAHLPFPIWHPDQCPRCQAGIPVETVSDAAPPAERRPS